jgi:hypothetical protein
MCTVWRVLAPIVLLAGWPAGARAEEPTAQLAVAPDRFATRALTLEMTGGTDTPAGDWSLGLGVELGRRAALAFAIGEDVSGRHLRMSLAPRLRLLIHGPLALDAGVVLSRGDGDELGGPGVGPEGRPYIFERRFETFYRIQPELGLEYRLTSRFGLRAFGGVGFPLTASQCWYASGDVNVREDCRSPSIPEELRRRDRVFPYFGLSLGVGLTPLGAPAPQDWRNLPRTSGWYGWQTLSIDGAALLTGLVAPGDAPVYVAVADLTGVALVHVLHQQPGRAAASVGIRVLLVTLGAMLGAAVLPRGGPEGEELAGAAPGALTGAVAASLLDAFVLAREPPLGDRRAE